MISTMGEFRPVFDDWHVIARSEEVTAGKMLTATVLGQDLIIWRYGRTLNVWKDACIHRGAKLSNGELCDDGVVRCPYHGWEFASGGRCVFIPAQKDRPVSNEAKAVAFSAVDRYGWVWVNISGSDAPLPPYEEFDTTGFEVTNCGPYSLKAWGTRIVENFVDVSHLPFVHSGILGSVDDCYVENYEARIEGGTVVADPVHVIQPNPDGSQLKTQVLYSYQVFKPLAAKFTKRFGGKTLSILLAVTPVRDGESLAWMSVAVNYSMGTKEQIMEFQDLLMEQDRTILEHQRPSKLPLDLRSEFHLASDKLSLAYRKWLRDQKMEYGVL